MRPSLCRVPSTSRSVRIRLFAPRFHPVNMSAMTQQGATKKPTAGEAFEKQVQELNKTAEKVLSLAGLMKSNKQVAIGFADKGICPLLGAAFTLGTFPLLAAPGLNVN